MNKNAVRTASGIGSVTMSTERTFSRKTMLTRVTTIASSIFSFTRLMTPTVLTASRATTTPPTASWPPLTRAATRKASPTLTSATWRTKTGTPFSAPTTTCSRSLTLSISPRPLTTDHVPLASMTFPPTFRLLRKTASTTADRGSLKARRRFGSTSIWYWRTSPPMLATSATPGTALSWYRMYQSWMDRRSRSERPWPSTVYQKTCPTPVASGPRVGTTPVGRDFDSRLSRSSTRVRAKYRSTESSKITLIIEKPNADEERTTRTPGKPWRLTVSGYVIWSSTSWGERPVQSVKTMTWLSERSGIASMGVVRSAQYPQPASRAKEAITRKRFLSDTSMSQLITAALPRPRRRGCLSRVVAGRRR